MTGFKCLIKPICIGRPSSAGARHGGGGGWRKGVKAVGVHTSIFVLVSKNGSCHLLKLFHIMWSTFLCWSFPWTFYVLRVGHNALFKVYYAVLLCLGTETLKLLLRFYKWHGNKCFAKNNALRFCFIHLDPWFLLGAQGIVRLDRLQVTPTFMPAPGHYFPYLSPT